MVLKRFLRSKLASRDGTHRVPTGTRVYAIGDIHGRLDLLDQLLATIDLDHDSRGKTERTLVFVGDLVDRGPESKGVIDRLISLRDSGVNARFLMGNHDETLLKAALGNVKATKFLTRIGGRDTILSYGISTADYSDASYEDLARMLSEHVPASHKAFLASFEDYAEIGDYLFVHAGIRPGVPLLDQASEDLRWIRSEFLNYRHPHQKMVVHGHSISDEPELRGNRIGIDTGAFATGRLTAVGLEGAERWLLTATGEADERWGRLTD